MNEQAGATNDA